MQSHVPATLSLLNARSSLWPVSHAAARSRKAAAALEGSTGRRAGAARGAALLPQAASHSASERRPQKRCSRGLRPACPAERSRHFPSAPAEAERPRPRSGGCSHPPALPQSPTPCLRGAFRTGLVLPAAARHRVPILPSLRSAVPRTGRPSPGDARSQPFGAGRKGSLSTSPGLCCW